MSDKAIRVFIRDNDTGEVRSYVDSGEYDWNDNGSFDEFVWSYGNYGCDCNRFLKFERAAGNDPNLGDPECGEVRFSVRIERADNGEEVYSDGEWPRKAP